MIRPFKKTLYNCREATLLSIKKEESRISLFERLKLGYHLLYCEPCRRFILQWQMLGQKKRGINAGSSLRPPFALPKEAKERIQLQLDLLRS